MIKWIFQANEPVNFEYDSKTFSFGKVEGSESLYLFETNNDDLAISLCNKKLADVELIKGIGYQKRLFPKTYSPAEMSARGY